MVDIIDLEFPPSVSGETGGPLADECAVFVQQMVLGPTLKTLLQLFYCSSWHQQGGTVAHQQGQVRREHHLSIPSSLASCSEGASYSFTPAANAAAFQNTVSRKATSISAYTNFLGNQ